MEDDELELGEEELDEDGVRDPPELELEDDELDELDEPPVDQ